MKHVIELDWRKVAGENCSQEEGSDSVASILRMGVAEVSLQERELSSAISPRKKSTLRGNMGCARRTYRSWRPAMLVGSTAKTNASGSQARDGGFPLSGVRGEINFAGKTIAGDEGGSQRHDGCGYGRVRFALRENCASPCVVADVKREMIREWE